MGNYGKVPFSEIWYGWGFGLRGTHEKYLRNPRRPIGSVAAWELNYPESIQF
jgi:hypothetical protein